MPMRMLKPAAALAAAALSAAVAGCASAPLPPPQPTLDNIQAVRAADLAPMAIGAFTAAPGKPKSMDRSIQVRADSQPAPKGGYAQYLGDNIGAQLNAAGRLDPASKLVISGVIVDSYVDSAMPTARASLSARFTLTRDGKVVFEKTLTASATWNSDFMGAVAIPDAFNHYTGLFDVLAAKLLADPEFQAAAKR